jgi:hypothetical protein
MTDLIPPVDHPDVTWILGIDILHFDIGLKLMNHNFSSDFLRDRYSEAAHGGYRDILVGLTDFISTYQDLMTLDDYRMPIAYLSFVYYFEVDGKPIRLNFPSEWEQTLDVTENLVDIWIYILTNEHRPQELFYFGSNPVLESVDVLGR